MIYFKNEKKYKFCFIRLYIYVMDDYQNFRPIELFRLPEIHL